MQTSLPLVYSGFRNKTKYDHMTKKYRPIKLPYGIALMAFALSIIPAAAEEEKHLAYE